MLGIIALRREPGKARRRQRASLLAFSVGANSTSWGYVAPDEITAAIWVHACLRD